MIRFQCSRCGKKLKAEVALSGRKVKCPKCREANSVPFATGNVDALSVNYPSAGDDSPAAPLTTGGRAVPSRQPSAGHIEPRHSTAASTGKMRRTRLWVVVSAAVFALFATGTPAVLWLGGVFKTAPDRGSPSGAGKSTPVAINPDLFKGLRRVAKEIEASQDTGLTRADFGKLLQQFATELSVAKDEIRTDGEKEVLKLFGNALEIWKASAELWDAKISMPALKRDAEAYTKQFAGGDLKKISSWYKYVELLVFEKLPAQTFPDKKENMVGVLAKHHELRIKEENGWKWIDADSFKQLWVSAAKKVHAADALVKNTQP